MHFFMGLFTYTPPQAQVGRIQSLRAVFVCACVCKCVYVVIKWIILQTSLIFIFSVLSLESAVPLQHDWQYCICVCTCRYVSACGYAFLGA